MDILRYLNIMKQQQQQEPCSCNNNSSRSSSSLYAKYAPTNLGELEPLLSPGLAQQLLEWMEAVTAATTTATPKPVALLVGPAGSMKGILAKLAAAQLGRETESIGTLLTDPTLLQRRAMSLVLTANAMDNFDGTGVDMVKQTARTFPRVPILISCCSELYGKVTELSRITRVFVAGPPKPHHLQLYAARILAGEGLDPLLLASKIVDRCSPDFCQVASNIELNRSSFFRQQHNKQQPFFLVTFQKDPRQDALSVLAEHLFCRRSEHKQQQQQQQPSVACSFLAFSAEGGLYTSLVAENYLDAASTIEAAAAAAEDISAGEVMESALYATQNWHLLDAWIGQAAVMPCHRVTAAATTTTTTTTTKKPRFSKVWSLFSNASQRNQRLLHVRHAMLSTSKVFHPDCLDIALSIASMLWHCLTTTTTTTPSSSKVQLPGVIASTGISLEVAHHLTRMAGRTQYKPAHHKLLKAAYIPAHNNE